MRLFNPEWEAIKEFEHTALCRDVQFDLAGHELPEDHGFALFEELARHLPWLRETPEAGVHPVHGAPSGRNANLVINELQVRAPLKEVGLTKAEIRTFSAELGLPTADKPQLACLSSRIPYGEEVTQAKLRMIEAAEAFLHDQGLREVRVRHHTLSQGALARLEVGPDDFARVVVDGLPGRVADRLKAIGYTQVTLDLQGYRRGSANEPIRFVATPPAPRKPPTA